MQIIKRSLMLALVALSAGGVSFGVLAQPRPMEAGVHYEKIVPPLALARPADIIEVRDIFWYGCPLCGEFEPMMTYWGGEVRGDLVMARMPAIWNEIMKTHARLYYTAVELGNVEVAHPAAFRAIHTDKMPLNSEEQVRRFFIALGVTAESFEQAWNSDKVAAALIKAEAETAAAGIGRLPALLVNGRYRVVRSENVPELTEVIVTANQLVRVLRDERRID